MTKKDVLTAKDFVHLHNHTQYSLLDGLTKVPQLIDYIAKTGMEAVAITDHGTLSGAIEFYKAAKAGGIKPIIGMEAYVAPRGHVDKDPVKDKNAYHLILLAMNNTGYQNLMRLSSIANLNGYYYRPRIDHALLEKYNEGLIALSGCIGGEVGDSLRQGQYDQARKIASWYKSVFGERYYLEVQDHGHPEHTSVWQEQVAVTDDTFRLADELDISCVLTCDAHYLTPEDQEAHEILLCVQTGAFLSDANRMSLKQFELHVTDPREIIRRWGNDHPEVILNTRLIAESCNVEIALGNILIPKFSVPKGQTERSFLEKLVYEGLVWRYVGKKQSQTANMTVAAAKKLLPDSIKKRAEYELGVIEQMNFCGYFLIIADFINHGKDKGIVFGPGRGSAAGSIIAYSLRITELDPLEYDLLFERFLNPDRISMPDIDIDIQDSRRDEVIAYCIDKYGKDRVANIATFGTMAARNAIRDVARVLQVPYATADRLAKMIPLPIQGRHIPLADSLKNNGELRNEYKTDEEARRVFDLAVQLEGTIRSHGVHAAGVVIAPDEIVSYTPLEMAQKGVIATQYSMGPIEDLGLLKIDFLGLSNLTIIKNTLRIVKKVYRKEINIDAIPLDDVLTFELLQCGDTIGVFQLESAGMKRYLKQLQPTTFDDIIAMVALYRPGPMQWIDDFIARKHGQRKITYLHPAMEAALNTTYGVIVYQEQVMQISKDLCGFTGGQADTLRKGIAKKIPEVLKKMKIEFIEGAIKHSKADGNAMEQFWKQLEAFAAYAFPKAHASCYAMIAYWTAYLKSHYPAAFMAALMTSDYDNTDRLAIEINECQHMGIEVLSPDVNESFIEFAMVPQKQQIRYGMAAIKNVGTAAVEEILRARQEHVFDSLEDFFDRVNVSAVNRKALESLIKTGAFDSFGARSTLLSNLPVLLAYANRSQKQKNSGQTDLFGTQMATIGVKPKLHLDESLAPNTESEQLQWERELLGIYLSNHPLEAYKPWLAEQTVPISKITVEQDNKTARVGGVIIDNREITTKNGQKMAFIRLSDEYGDIELVLFPKVYHETAVVLQRDNVVFVRGKISGRDRSGRILSEPKILVEDVKQITLTEAEAYSTTGKKERSPKSSVKNALESTDRPPSISIPKRVYIRLLNSENHQMLLQLKEAIDTHLGHTEVVLILGHESQKQVIKLPTRIQSHKAVLRKLQNLVGEANVKVH